MSALERHYTISEIAAAWNYSPKTVRNLFAQMEGVVRISNPSGRRKRPYVTLRVPASLLEQTHQRLTAGAGEVKSGRRRV